MPPRLNKRQQRELEELEALGSTSKAQISSDEEGPVPKKAVFSNFLATEEAESESDKEEGSVKPAKSRKKKKNKKKGEASGTNSPAPSKVQATSPIARNEKKALKKAKAKEKKAGDDELEQALAELSVKYPDIQKPMSTTADSRSLATLLSVSLTHLDSEAEMRKFFGARVIQANKSGSSSGSGPRRNAAIQRSNLTRPQPSWWSASQREGLSIRTLTEDEVQDKQKRHEWDSVGEKWWTVDYSQRYKSMTKLFIQAVMSGHPDALWEVQKKLPWHADNLLQLAEVYRHREEYAQAVDFVDRAIFTYERAFIGAFNFTGGINRLDFDRVENRPFFLAIHRQISDLQRRGCVRTAFEFARLLYSLDPWEDPHGALYHLDLLALKSGMAQWLVDLYDHFVRQREQKKDKPDARMDPSVLPGFAYGRALALKILEDAKPNSDHQASTAALKDALLSFPSIVPLLADKIEVTLPTSIRGHRDFKIETDAGSLTAPLAVLHALSHMYVLRSSQIWKEPSHTSWFLSTTTSTFSTLPSTLPITSQRQAFLTLMHNENLRYAIYRHIVVLETTHRRLFAFMPPQVLEAAKSLACDPLPPRTALSKYDDAYFQGTEDIWTARQPQSRRQRALENQILEQAIPDAEVRRRVAHVLAGLGDQFGGGLVDMLERLGPEAVEDMLGQVQAMVLGGGEGGMPGELPGLDDLMQVQVPVPGAAAAAAPAPAMPAVAAVDDETGWVEGDRVEANESDSDSDEENTSTVRRVLRGLLGRFWGGGTVQADETSSDEDVHQPIDDTGVD